MRLERRVTYCAMVPGGVREKVYSRVPGLGSEGMPKPTELFTTSKEPSVAFWIVTLKDASN